MKNREKTDSGPAIEQLYPRESLDGFKEELEDLVERDLRPYADDDFLWERLEGQNRLLRRAPELQGQIEAAISAQDDESLLALVDAIEHARQQHAPQREKAIQKVLPFLTICNPIQKQIVDDESRRRANLCMRRISQNFAYAFPPDQLLDADLTAEWLKSWISRNEDKLSEAGKKQLAIWEAKIELVLMDIRKRRTVYNYIDKFPDDIGHDPATHEKAVADTMQVVDIFAAVRASQQYGIKMGYIAADRGGTFIFGPPFDMSNSVETGRIHSLAAVTGSIAQIVHSRKTSHNNLKRKFKKQQNYVQIILTREDPIVEFSLGQEGELYTDPSCRTLLRDIAVEKGKYEAYRELQATILAHYFDITHFLDGAMWARQEVVQSSPYTALKDRGLESIARLVVPRIRYLIEAKEGAEETDGTDHDAPTRQVRGHDVVWHVRKLPEGWFASPAAIELAKSLGVRLDEGETIVREHKRGSRLLGEITAYQLVKRPATE